MSSLLCAKLCLHDYTCGGYYVDKTGCYACGAGSNFNDTACTSAAPFKGCTTNGDCVVCDKEDAPTATLMSEGGLVNVTVWPSSACSHYVAPAQALTFARGIEIRARNTITMKMKADTVTFQGSVRLAAPNVTVAHYVADRTHVTNTRKLRADNVSSTSPEGAFVVADSPELDAIMSRILKAASTNEVAHTRMAIGFTNTAGVAQITCVSQQGVLLVPRTDTRMLSLDAKGCDVIDVGAFVGVFGERYEAAFVNGGVFTSSREALSWLSALSSLALATVVSMPLLHTAVSSLAYLTLSRRHLPHVD